VIWIFSDHLSKAGGIETYLHALCSHLVAEKIQFRLAVAEMEVCPFVAEFAALGVEAYRQKRVLGDRWSVRQHLLCSWLFWHLRPGDWVYCLRQPKERIYERLVRGVHRKQARLAASWMFTPDALDIEPQFLESFKRAVQATDKVISVSSAGVPFYRSEYGYQGKVHVVPYHNLALFPAPLPMPPEKPWRFGFIGRLHEEQKNLKALITAFAAIASTRQDVTLDLHGGGPDRAMLEAHASALGCTRCVRFHGEYDHRKDLPQILSHLHCVVYTSHYEGGPCFSLLEAMQAGRYCVAAQVGGIPDLYEGHPEAGLLVENGSVPSITTGLNQVIEGLECNRITLSGPRLRYESAFTMEHAHAAWCKALELRSRK